MNKLYLIDFGISSRFLDENNNHIPFEQNVSFKGNLIFSSKNAFAEVTLSRRDDIISLVYFLIFCVNSKQSWIDAERPISDQYDEIARYKINTKPIDFVNNQTKCFLPLLRYAYKLEFEERPDYRRIQFLMKKILLNRDFIPNNTFDWSIQQEDRDHRNHGRLSSISSCGIPEEQLPWLENIHPKDR